MGWLYLVLAGSFEVLGVIGMNRIKLNKGWSSYVIAAIAFCGSFTFLTLAMQTISMGTAYAVWTGIGTVGATLLGMILYNESKDWRRILFMSMILASAVGLKLIS
ncbi:multidrug efflux SMR transporter [Tumebacillus sp. DT12]|uniref:Multidrug efflux SMR transporter n=1 Tax=Tumebacillus lacus TaxID=2995335 RepID=A0ABT3WW69_9BACL|nr:multidrug efflux SMR transporter [Tumebacillus lacus]MCX7568919.1 multidrug efflux SMR transporter [Tumebacillus lacus]